MFGQWLYHTEYDPRDNYFYDEDVEGGYDANAYDQYDGTLRALKGRVFRST